MNKLLLTSLIAATTTFTTLLASTTAQAVSDVSQDQYEQQYQGVSNELLRLDYNTWKGFNDLVNQELNLLNVDSLPMVDLSLLSWENGASDVEVYFINEGATHRNQLFYSTDAGDTKEIIFDDIASSLSILNEDDGSLALGQGIGLGDFSANTFLEFFLKPNGANDPNRQTYFGYDAANNPDNISHITGHQVGEYILLGFEDIWGGGDFDYNDTVFVVKGVTSPAQSEAVPVPEPGMALSLATLGILGATLRKGKS